MEFVLFLFYSLIKLSSKLFTLVMVDITFKVKLISLKVILGVLTLLFGFITRDLRAIEIFIVRAFRNMVLP